MASPWLIAGLGNPGPRYEQTRHNAGFWFLEALAARHGLVFRYSRKLLGRVVRERLESCHLILLAPDTWMNRSGQAVRAAADYYDLSPDRLLVAHDDLDLPPGVARFKRGGGHGGHNGLRSLFEHLGTPDFWRLRIGIGHPGLADAVTPWVLSRAPADDDQAIREAIGRAAEVLPEFLAGRAGEAMKVLHAPTPRDSGKGRDSGLGTRDSKE